MVHPRPLRDIGWVLVYSIEECAVWSNGIQSIAVLGSIARPQGHPFLTFILSLSVTHVLIATSVRIAERVDIPRDCYPHMLQSRCGHQKVNLACCEHFTFIFTRIPQLQHARLTLSYIQPKLCKNLYGSIRSVSVFYIKPAFFDRFSWENRGFHQPVSISNHFKIFISLSVLVSLTTIHRFYLIIISVSCVITVQDQVSLSASVFQGKKKNTPNI